MKQLTRLAAVVVILSLSPPLPAEVINGGFETGNLEGWTASASFYGSQPASVTTQAENAPTEGEYLAHLGALSGGPNDGLCYSQLQQQFSVAAGEILLFDWYAIVTAQGYAFEGGEWHARARAEVSVYETDPWSPLFHTEISADAMGPWYSSNNTGGWSTEVVEFSVPGSYTLQFRVQGELTAMGSGRPEFPVPNTGGFIGVDNVRIVPEPSTLLLLSMGAVVLFVWKRCQERMALGLVVSYFQ